MNKSFHVSEKFVFSSSFPLFAKNNNSLTMFEFLIKQNYFKLSSSFRKKTFNPRDFLLQLFLFVVIVAEVVQNFAEHSFPFPTYLWLRESFEGKKEQEERVKKKKKK